MHARKGRYRYIVCLMTASGTQKPQLDACVPLGCYLALAWSDTILWCIEQ